MTRPGIDPESVVLVADALSTRPLICMCYLCLNMLQPEMQAQCTLINFTVTKDGLEEQLLAEVVRSERPDLEELKV